MNKEQVAEVFNKQTLSAILAAFGKWFSGLVGSLIMFTGGACALAVLSGDELKVHLIENVLNQNTLQFLLFGVAVYSVWFVIDSFVGYTDPPSNNQP